MRDREQQSCQNFHQLLDVVATRSSERKRRLLAAALCRYIWPFITDDACRTAVEVVEQYADGFASAKGLEQAYAASSHATTAGNKAAVSAVGTPFRLSRVGMVATCALDAVVIFARQSSFEEEDEAHRRLLLDIFDVALSPISPTTMWLNHTVRACAVAAYEMRELPSGHLDPARLAVLADALEETGCSDAFLLGHLRGPGPHVRGCWALDLVLGKS